MAQLFGKAYSRKDLLQRTGDISQIAGVSRSHLVGGKAQGVEALEFRTGGGLAFVALAGRCLDIARAEYQGVPLAWLSPTGIVSAEYYDPRQKEWLRSFFGGLLTTCGLTQVGSPCVDQGEELGLHGRISNTPAEDVNAGGRWEGDEYLLWAHGTMREVRALHENLRLDRGISTYLGSRSLSIRDTVTNMGEREVPHMLLYHINLGFPLVDEPTELLTPALEVLPRDEQARQGAEELARFGPPTPGFQEQVYYHHRLGTDADGFTRAAVVNRSFGGGRGLGVYVRWKPAELPYMVQWKMMAPGSYVLAVEPANCHVDGRVAERDRGTLQHLRPGEERLYQLEIGVLDGPEEIAAVADEIAELRRRARAQEAASSL